jgi:hypothetical protein
MLERNNKKKRRKIFEEFKLNFNELLLKMV